MSPPAIAPASAPYRRSQREGPDPITEADAMALLLTRSAALRRRLLVLALIGAMAAGAATAILYVSVALRVYGRVIGGCFAVGGIVGFVILHKLSRLIAHRFEARWAADLSRRHNLGAGALTETVRMLD